MWPRRRLRRCAGDLNIFQPNQPNQIDGNQTGARRRRFTTRSRTRTRAIRSTVFTSRRSPIQRSPSRFAATRPTTPRAAAGRSRFGEIQVYGNPPASGAGASGFDSTNAQRRKSRAAVKTGTRPGGLSLPMPPQPGVEAATAGARFRARRANDRAGRPAWRRRRRASLADRQHPRPRDRNAEPAPRGDRGRSVRAGRNTDRRLHAVSRGRTDRRPSSSNVPRTHVSGGKDSLMVDGRAGIEGALRLGAARAQCRHQGQLFVLHDLFSTPDLRLRCRRLVDRIGHPGTRSTGRRPRPSRSSMPASTSRATAASIWKPVC